MTVKTAEKAAAVPAIIAVNKEGKEVIVPAKEGTVLPPVTPEYAVHIAKELLRVLDTVQPKAEKSYSADFGAQVPNYEAGKPISRADMKKSGKTADDIIKFRRMADRFASTCVALAQTTK